MFRAPAESVAVFMVSENLPAFATAGLASLVEFTEALTVLLAVGAGRGWRSAIAGGGAGLVVLIGLVVLFGPGLAGLMLGPAKIAVGTLLVLFGLRWLRKATRRAAGILPQRDEEAALRRHSDRFGRNSGAPMRWDGIGFIAAFQAVVVEGLEVVFIVVAVGSPSPGLLEPAVLGALAALVLVVVLGAVLHGPLTRVPQNTLKRLIGAVLAGLGTFWIGDGAGLGWPGDDAAILGLGLGFYALSVLAASLLRRAPAGARP